jgi:hypothetical protein
MILWIVLGVVVLSLGGLLLLLGLTKGEQHDIFAFPVDERDVTVRMEYGASLPKTLGHDATTLNFLVCFRSYPGWSVFRVKGRPPIGRPLVANELFHVIDRMRRGWWGYWKRVVLGWLKHPFNHDARDYEIESWEAMLQMLSGTYPGVDVSRILARFV